MPAKKQKTMKEQLQKHLPSEARSTLPPVVKPEDTSRRDSVVHLLGMLGGGTSSYIEGMEKEGQNQLAKSTTIPSRLMDCTEDQLRSLGFELGPKPTKREEDQLFRPALLPKGWKIAPTDHSMWSDLIDNQGRVRGSIFYKAAFYDREAFMSLKVRVYCTEDYDARNDGGTIRMHVIARMPGKVEKVFHVIEHETKFPDHREARGSDHPYFRAVDETRKRASEWLAANFPKHGDPLAYWDDTEF